MMIVAFNLLTKMNLWTKKKEYPKGTWKIFWTLSCNVKQWKLKSIIFQYLKARLELGWVVMSKHPFVFVVRSHKPEGQELLLRGSEDHAGRGGPTHL